MVNAINSGKIKENKGWQVAVLDNNFIWPVHIRDFKYPLPRDMYNGKNITAPAYITGVSYACLNRLTNRDVYLMRNNVSGEVFVINKAKTYLKNTLESGVILSFAEVTGMKGLRGLDQNNHPIFEYYKLTPKELKDITTSEQIKLLKKDLEKPLMLPLQYGDQWIQKIGSVRSWRPLKGSVGDDVKKHDYACVLNMSRLKDANMRGSYFMKVNTVLNNPKLDVRDIRADGKEFIAVTDRGKIDFIFLTKKELKYILNYMGVNSPRELDFKILRRHMLKFYDNLDIYRKLYAYASQSAMQENIQPEKQNHEEILEEISSLFQL